MINESGEAYIWKVVTHRERIYSEFPKSILLEIYKHEYNNE